MELTAKQQRFFRYMEQQVTENGCAPSLREAAEEFGISRNAVAQLIGQLEKKRVIKREGRYSRSVRILPRQTRQKRPQRGRIRELPVVGQITAGVPMYAQQEWDGSILVDGTLFSGNNLFCLRIRGKSMEECGILDGDLVICEPRQYAEDGEIVAVLIAGEEATVKRFFVGEDYVELRPENKAFSPVRYPFSEIMVQGKVVGVLRDQLRHDG